jgi:hypothetical protein
MVGLVTHRPFKKEKTIQDVNNKFRRKIKLIYPKFNISVKWVRIIFIVIIFIYWIFFIIKNTLLKPENYIKNIYYGKYSVEMYDNPYLYQKIWNIIRDENIYTVSKIKRRSILKQINQEFVMVKDISIVQPEKFWASVQLEFYEPEIVIKLWEKKFWIIWDESFEIYSWNLIWQDVFFVELPQYASWIDSLHGLFYEIPQDQFISHMHQIADFFQVYDRIVYLPWSSMTAVFLPWNKRIYINNQNSLVDQFKNYEDLQSYYEWFSDLRIIDLWSLNGNKIIVQ